MEIPFSKPNFVKNRTQKKRKGSSPHATFVEDQDTEEAKFTSDIECKRQIHSKIEKRRRDKMNTYISQLSTMIPTCNFTTHKLDKITVLRMAVQYLKSIRSSPMQLNLEENLKYSFISDVELKKLILQASEGFLFVVGCESGRILYVSQSVSKVLHCIQGDLLGRSLYDVIHPSDIDKVKEQISCADLNPRHKMMSLKWVKQMELDMPSEQLGLHPGNRRSFFFRIKSDIDNSGKYTMDAKFPCQNYNFNNDLLPTNTNICSSDCNQYTAIHSIGYLKCWNSESIGGSSKDNGEDLSSITCLIAVGRTLSNFLSTMQTEKPLNFVSKHTVDGKFLFVDHWVTLITGFLPQEILGTNIYEYIHPEDLNQFAESHQRMLQPFGGGNTIKNFRFRTKFSNYINIRSEWKSLHNPWKKDVEYFYSKNTVNWLDATKSEDKKKGDQTNSVGNELLGFTNFDVSDKEDSNFISDFTFNNTIDEKHNNETTMEAILKLLESDTNIAD